MEVFTIGFTKSSAEHFFQRLKSAGIRRLLDVRLNNISQLAGFAKRDDLAYFLRAICDAEYLHEPILAPTQALLDSYRKSGGTWAAYERDFHKIMVEREIETNLSQDLFSIPTVLLCSEDTPEHCHRRLILEYLQEKWGNIQATHL